MQRCLISLLSFCGLCFSPQFLVAEIDATKGDFSLDEAKVILQIRAAENPHGIDKMSPKEKVRDDVRLLSASNKMAFVSEIALGAIQRIDGGISGVSADRVSVSLLASTVDRDTKLETLKRIHDHGARKYYATWLSFFDRNSSLATNDMLQNRQALIWKSYENLNKSLRGTSFAERASMLFGILKDWKTPFDYEAAMLMISELHKTHPDEVVPKWTQMIITNVPDIMPPPFTREHTLFYILCVLGKSIGGADVLATLERIEGSGNQYAEENVLDALKWVRVGIPYPLEYRELRRAYHSRF